MSTFANSENPDEMQLNAAFHQGLHCCDGKIDLQIKEYVFLNYNLTPLDMYNGLSKTSLYQTKRKNSLVYKGLNIGPLILQLRLLLFDCKHFVRKQCARWS